MKKVSASVINKCSVMGALLSHKGISRTDEKNTSD